MRRLLLLLVLVVLVGASALEGFSQVSYYSDRAVGTVPVYSNGANFAALTPISYGQVRVCTQFATGSPCTPPAQVYDTVGNALSIVGGNFGQLTTDVVGRFAFGCTPGNYLVQVAASSSNVPQLSYSVTCPGNTTLLLSNNTWTGTNSFTNTASFSGGMTANSINNIRFSSQYASLNAAVADLASAPGTVFIDQATSVSSQISLASGQQILSNGSVPVTTTATTPLFKLNGVNRVVISGLYIAVNTTSATAGCFDFENTAGPTTSNYIVNNKCWQTITPNAPVTGQYGLQMNATTGANAMYWNHINDNDFNNLDRSIRINGTDASNVANDNYFNNNASHAANVHMEFTKFANENHVNSFSCSTGGGPASNICIVVGDGVNPIGNNDIRGAVGDQGVSGQTFQLKVGATYNRLEYIENNGVASTDANNTGWNMASVTSGVTAGISTPSLRISTWAGQSTSYPFVANSLLLGASSNVPHASIWGDTVGNKQTIAICSNNTTPDGTNFTSYLTPYGSLCYLMRSSSTDTSSLVEWTYRGAGTANGLGSQIASLSNTGLFTALGGLKAGSSGATISDTRELLQSVHGCGTTTTCSNTSNGSYRAVFGTVALTAGTATVASLPAFTSTASFGCSGTDQTATTSAVKIVPASTTSITITGNTTDTIFYLCVGN